MGSGWVGDYAPAPLTQRQPGGPAKENIPAIPQQQPGSGGVARLGLHAELQCIDTGGPCAQPFLFASPTRESSTKDYDRGLLGGALRWELDFSI